MPQKTYNLHLKGFVGGSDFDRDYVDYVLGRNAGKAVSVLIDSTGGSLATALSIASAFGRHGDVSVHFVGMNASAATIASLGAKHISIDTNAMYLVHQCSADFFEWGQLNADQMAGLIETLDKQKGDLEKMDANVAAMYARKCRKKPQCLLALMKTGGWLTAAEALEWGFVDEITDAPEDAAPKLTDAVASAMAAEGLPLPNIPVADKDSALARFFAAVSALFKHQEPPVQATDADTDTKEITSNPISLSTPMFDNSKYPCVCRTLRAFSDKQVAEVIAPEGLTEEQLRVVEMDLAECHAEIERLNAELEALRRQPAEQSVKVVDDKAAASAPVVLSPFEQAMADEREARAMFNLFA